MGFAFAQRRNTKGAKYCAAHDHLGHRADQRCGRATNCSDPPACRSGDAQLRPATRTCRATAGPHYACMDPVPSHASDATPKRGRSLRSDPQCDAHAPDRLIALPRSCEPSVDDVRARSRPGPQATRTAATRDWLLVCFRRTLGMGDVLGNEWRSLAGFTLLYRGITFFSTRLGTHPFLLHRRVCLHERCLASAHEDEERLSSYERVERCTLFH